MRNRNPIIIFLMVSSIVLLMVLQFFWLQSAFRDAGHNFRKETSALFRTTIFTMHDSLIQQNLQPVAGDSAWKQLKEDRMRIIEGGLSRRVEHDTIDHFIGIERREARVEVFLGADHDSLRAVLPPIMRRLQKDKGGAKTFILRMDSDSLKKDSIVKEFTKALANAGIEAPFTVHVSRSGKISKTKKIRQDFSTEFVRVDPVHEYSASFAGIHSVLLKKITPQVLFSGFLTLLTIGSFYVMYRSLRSQQKLMELKNDFISNVTHELKTPVATVSVALEALKNFNALNNPQRTAEYLEIAQNELNRLTLMTDKILKTSMFEANGVHLKIETIDLDELTRRVISSMRLVFEKRAIKLDFERMGTDFRLEGGEEHLTNVLYNLIDNALKYSPDGSVIRVVLSDDEHHVRLQIKDQGIGIQRQYQQKIFEKFFRVPSGDIHNTKGYGLGLSYVAGVVESHHGKISVESEPGQGSVFSITLPRRHEN